MVIDLKFSKFNDTPWGFRLTGGADFDYPLTVIKVTEGSLAAHAGMQVNDVIVRINDTPASNLSHLDAHNVLLAAGNNFMLGIMRENEQDHDHGVICSESVVRENPPAEVSAAPTTLQEDTIIEEPAKEAAEEKLMEAIVSDDQIAEIISSEAEVLKEHNIIGVNFNKIIPQALSLKTSEVFKTLNAQAVQTRDEKIQEERKWTTFLQKPNRPIPKSKWDIEQEKREAYKVKIVKQPKPRIAPDRVHTPPPVEILPDPPKVEDEKISEDEESPDPVEETNPVLDDEEINLQNENLVELVTSTTDDEVPDLEVEIQEEPENPDELSRELEEKLADVQRQLLSLSNLPHAIQATLDAVTEQLSKIVPTPKEESSENPAECQEEYQEPAVEEINLEDHEISSIHEEIEYQQPQDLDEKPQPDQPELVPEEKPQKPIEDTEKGQETEEDWEHQQRLIRERTPKKPPKPKLTTAFGPLVPQERPIFLPGGRKWRNAKDAFNEDFIAEVLSSQAELIVGTTLGNTYESPLLPYDRVNFLKYQKPEKKVDLRNSEVYRMIHRMDKEPTHGIAVRAEKVFTADDVHRCSSPLANCGQ